MNEQTSKLIEQLAQKLGTTTEYLWSVLLKQAPFDAAITLGQIALIVLFGIILFRIHKKLNANTDWDGYGDKGYDNPVAGVVMIICFIVFVVFAGIGLFAISDVVTGFFNPEYWALDRILSGVK